MPSVPETFESVQASARREALYAFLSERGPLWTRTEHVVRVVRGYPGVPNKSFHNSRARRVLTQDIEAINDSDQFDKIVISGNHGIKLATRGEFTKFIEAEYREIFTKLSRVRRIARKGGLDRQQDLEGGIREAFLGEETV